MMMFKILILERLYNLSDEQMEFQINDRATFKRFLGLNISARVPDTNTIWTFREKLKHNDNEKKLFECFYTILESQGLIVDEGKMVPARRFALAGGDASFHEVPCQRNTREENKQIKQGQVPEHWKEQKHKLSHKDTDATWTKKNNETYYGYKNHIKADAGSKLIDDYTVTTASVHDSSAIGGLPELLTSQDQGQPLHADSAYSGVQQATIISENKMINQVHEKGYRNKPLTEEQKQNNRQKSKVRARIEHIFGFNQNSMKGSFMRCIGIQRAKVVIGLSNLTYNICRAVQLGIAMLKVRCALS